MMQSADFRNSDDSSQSLPLNRTRFRRILCQGQMSPDIQIVTEISFENPSQMRLSEHDDVVEAFPANSSILLRSPFMWRRSQSGPSALVPRGLSAT